MTMKEKKNTHDINLFSACISRYKKIKEKTRVRGFEIIQGLFSTTLWLSNKWPLKLKYFVFIVLLTRIHESNGT